MTELGDVIHYQIAKATPPPSSSDHLSFYINCYLLTIMNLKKLEVIFESCLHDSIQYLASPIGANKNNLFFREDSPGSENSSQESTESNNSHLLELEILEQERRTIELIDRKISSLNIGEGTILTYQCITLSSSCILTGENLEDLVGL